MRLIDSDLLIKMLPDVWEEDPDRSIKISTLIAISRTPEVHLIKRANRLRDVDKYICGNCGKGVCHNLEVGEYYFCPRCGAQLLDLPDGR